MAEVTVVWPDVLEQLVSGKDLTEAESGDVLRVIMAGEAEPTQVAAFLVALRAKGESPGEIAGLVRAMTEHARSIVVDGPLVDTCGTGGDRSGSFNISTTAALVVATAGVRVAKHGNRSASSQCGSADLLEAWGVAIELEPEHVATTIEELGIGFLYARTFHPAMRFVAPVRAQLGIRTVFNVLGPLTNPAGAQHQTVGVSDPELAPKMAEALALLGKRHALVFHGSDGLDELTTTGPSRLWEIRDGRVTESTFDPQDVGVARATPADLQGGGVDVNTAISDAVLDGEPGPRADIVALNAGAALYAADVVDSIAAGVERAREVLASGDALMLKDAWVARSQELAG